MAVFSSGDAHPYCRVGRSEFASVHLLQCNVHWLCASCVKLQFTLSLQTVLRLLKNIEDDVLHHLWEWHPS